MFRLNIRAGLPAVLGKYENFSKDFRPYLEMVPT